MGEARRKHLAGGTSIATAITLPPSLLTERMLEAIEPIVNGGDCGQVLEAVAAVLLVTIASACPKEKQASALRVIGRRFNAIADGEVKNLVGLFS